MSTLATLMTVEEYRRLPNPGNGAHYELHHGEVVLVSAPKQRHVDKQVRIAQILGEALRSFGFCWTEVPFRPAPEHEVWVADVAVVSWERWRSIDPDDNLGGAPEIVVEVMSPSNTWTEMEDKAETCFAGGALQFWTVRTDGEITVRSRDGVNRTFSPGVPIPMDAFGIGPVTVPA
ncbi:MAG: Uma2 family endonuclease [Acidobacteria bacterium]|nr:Uma2 family endonuclease [Acidobacteriota bacterium]